MGKKLYRQEPSGEIHTLNPQGHYVTLPTSTIDLMSAPLRGAEGPVALSSVIENVWQRQITLMNAPHSAAQRELTLQRPSGVAPERSVEAPTDATLESLRIESLGGMEESPLPLIPKRLNTPTSPRLPWNDSQMQGRTAQPAAPTRSSPSPSGTDSSKAGLPPRGTR